LTELDCQDNQITTLDVSNNSALTELDCQDNQIITIDVSRNELIQIVDVAPMPTLKTFTKNISQHIYDIHGTSWETGDPVVIVRNPDFIGDDVELILVDVN